MSSKTGNESNWRVTDVDSVDHDAIVVQADFKTMPTSCPKCGSSHRPRRYGNLEAGYRDAPFLGRHVTISVNVQRFRCYDCGQAFFQQLTDMDGKRRMTVRCATYVIDQVMARSSMKDVARMVGVDEKTVRNVFEDRGVIFSIGDFPHDDRLACESCLGIHPGTEMRLVPTKHFGRWRKGELRPDVNVCTECLDFAGDPWRAGMVRRLK